MQVYPRACGGTPEPARLASLERGLSPRVRGNLAGLVERHASAGSIPARAGEPTPRRFYRNFLRVYPRACGGTMVTKHHTEFQAGLSPRVRGNPSPA